MPNLQVNSNLGSTGQYVGDGTNNSPLSLTDGTTGKVGIGTNTPGAQLHVSGGTGSCEVIIEADNDNIGEDDQPSLTLKQDGGLVSSKIGYFESTNDLTIKTMNQTGSIHLGTYDTKRVTVDENGNVGIGTAAPDSALHITRNSGELNKGFLTLEELSADASAPAANKAAIFLRDNGSGKTQLCVKFNTGAVQVIATQP